MSYTVGVMQETSSSSLLSAADASVASPVHPVHFWVAFYMGFYSVAAAAGLDWAAAVESHIKRLEEFYEDNRWRSLGEVEWLGREVAAAASASAAEVAA
jgi:hypothetical protein